MNNTERLENFLLAQAGKKILIIGKESLFDRKEIERFLRKHNIEISDNACRETVAVLEAKKLNPVEEMESEQAYEMGIPSYKLMELEELMSAEIDDDSLLMAVKLGRDQERIIRMLSNPHISNSLFVRLLRLYEWDPEEEDSRDDRNVIMYTLRRYVKIKPNEENLLYSYLTLRRVATETEDADLLMALIRFHNFEFMVRGKERITLKETIARNSNINREIIIKLLSMRDRRIDISLAGNQAVDVETLSILKEKNDPKIDMAMATNPRVDNDIFQMLLDADDDVVKMLLFRQAIDETRYKMIANKDFKSDFLTVLASNESLDEETIEKLAKSTDESVLEHLAFNRASSPQILEKLYSISSKNIDISLAKNKNTPIEILNEIYLRYKKDIEVLKALAFNSSLSIEKLTELYRMDEFEINKGLATNKNLPRDMIEHLKLDSRLQSYLGENEILIKEYETVFEYDEKSIRYTGE